MESEKFALPKQFEDRLRAREIWIDGYVGEDFLQHTTFHVWQWNREDDKKVGDYTPIKVFINSSGGHCTEGNAFIEQLLSAKAPVETYNMGKCYSMGFNIFLAGKKRFAYKTSSFMQHSITSGDYGKVNDMKASQGWLDQLQEMSDKYIKSRTNLTMKEVKALSLVDRWWFGEEALKDGIVTHLL